MSHHKVAAEKLSFHYPDGTAALNGLSFHIGHGESVAIVGANGAGKSTLLLHLNGCLLPSQGRIVVGDLAVTPSTLDAIRRTVGTVFQDADDQLFMPTVLEDVCFGLLNLGMSAQESQTKALSALGRVGADHLQDRPPYRLSGGEKRRVALATVLALSPDILVLDEPTTGLDPQARRQLIQLLAGFQHTKIIATHDLDMALDLCERTIVLHQGEVAADDRTESILKNDALLERCHLERPLRLQGCPVCN